MTRENYSYEEYEDLLMENAYEYLEDINCVNDLPIYMDEFDMINEGKSPSDIMREYGDNENFYIDDTYFSFDGYGLPP